MDRVVDQRRFDDSQDEHQTCANAGTSAANFGPTLLGGKEDENDVCDDKKK